MTMTFATISDTIDASPAAVWDVIADFGGLQRWSRAVSSCVADGNVPGSHRTVQIGEVQIRELLEVRDPATWTMRYRPLSGSVMPVDDMTVTMRLTPRPGGKTDLDWSVAGTPAIPLDKALSILEKRYRSRIEELKQCVEPRR